MRILHPITLWRTAKLLCVVLIVRITAAVVLSYRDYLPPSFDSDFLAGRQPYFFGHYQWAFYTHIASGPCTLILGMVLLSERLRHRFPALHRTLGRVQVVCVLALVTPSGLWMAFYAATGVMAGTGFATLALATSVSVAMGWRAAVQQRYGDHRRWMCRCYVLLCSAVVLRIMGGLTQVTGLEAEWIYPVSAWASWLLPLAAFEITHRLTTSGNGRHFPAFRG